MAEQVDYRWGRGGPPESITDIIDRDILPWLDRMQRAYQDSLRLMLEQIQGYDAGNLRAYGSKKIN